MIVFKDYSTKGPMDDPKYFAITEGSNVNLAFSTKEELDWFLQEDAAVIGPEVTSSGELSILEKDSYTIEGWAIKEGNRKEE